MFFKPKIFISSTLNQSEVRESLKTFFESVGAEPLLYEHNLTPSYSKKVYLQDITNADFVIFIFDKRYGTKTDTGNSGIHEEWEMLKEVKVPFHIYVKESDDQEDEMKDFLTKEVHIDRYSYYQFSSDDSLLQRISKTIFQIAFEIENYKIDNKDFSEDILKQLVFKHDYELAIDLIKICNYFFMKFDKEFFIKYDIIDVILGVWADVYREDKYSIFVDRQFNDRIEPLMKLISDFIGIHSLITTRTYQQRKQFRLNDKPFEITKLDCHYNLPNWKTEENRLNNLLNKITKEFNEFKDYIFKTKIKFELTVS